MMHTVDDVAVVLAYVQCSHDQCVASSPPRLDAPPLELPTFALPARPLELPDALELLLVLAAAPFDGISTSARLFSRARTRFSKYVLVTLKSRESRHILILTYTHVITTQTSKRRNTVAKHLHLYNILCFS